MRKNRYLRQRVEAGLDFGPLIDTSDVVDRIQLALDRNALIPDDSDVIVDVDDTTVNLTGHVRTWAEHDAAFDAAWRADGVYKVHDQLVITG